MRDEQQRRLFDVVITDKKIVTAQNEIFDFLFFNCCCPRNVLLAEYGIIKCVAFPDLVPIHENADITW